MDEERTAEPDRSERARVLLARIAALLRVDPDFFLSPDAGRTGAEADTSEVLRIFRAIDDPALRRSVLTMLRDLERDDGAGKP